MVASAPSAGAETSTRLAPAVRCADAFSLAVKMPVHSSAMSTPSAFQGSFDGSRSAETLILPLPRLIESPSTVTVPEAAVHAVEAQQVGVGLDRAEIVDADHFDVLAAGLGDGTQHVAADAAKPVDSDPDCHGVSPLIAAAVLTGGSRKEVLGGSPGSAGRGR